MLLVENITSPLADGVIDTVDKSAEVVWFPELLAQVSNGFESALVTDMSEKVVPGEVGVALKVGLTVVVGAQVAL